MDIFLFILPLLAIPFALFILSLILGHKEKEKMIKSYEKIESKFDTLFRYSFCVLIFVLIVTLLRKEMIVENLNDQDLLVLILSIITVLIALNKEKVK